jgi:hypothetical protein
MVALRDEVTAGCMEQADVVHLQQQQQSLQSTFHQVAQ